MNLLHEIKSSLVQDKTNLGPIFLKLRILAAQLGSNSLEEWIIHESRGYPEEYNVPSYRLVTVECRGTFCYPNGAIVQDYILPPFLIEKFAGEKFLTYKIRESVAVIDTLSTYKNVQIDASDLIPRLQGKFFPGSTCNAIKGVIPGPEIANAKYAIQNRILDFILELEKSIPNLSDINIENPIPSATDTSEKTTNIFNKTIVHGDYTSVSSVGKGANVIISIRKNDDKALTEYLVKCGIPDEDASEFVEIVKSEQSENIEKPLGEKAQLWVSKNIPKVMNGTWKIAATEFVKILTEGALRYWGYK